MKNKVIKVALFFVAIACCYQDIDAQSKVISLPQSLPIAATANVEESVIIANPNKRIVYNVVKPSLLYYPGKNNISGTSVIIAPGGALQILSIDNEGVEVAKYLNENGIDAFVLKYSLVHTINNPQTEVNDNFFKTDAKRDSMISVIIPYATKDGLSAIEYVRQNATEYGLNPNRIGFMGFSAGGTVTMSVVYNCNNENRPNFIAPIYPWIGEMGNKVPQEKTPAFIVVANDDHLKLVPHSLNIFNKWKAADQPAELLVYGRGGHGFGADKNINPTDGWLKSFIDWLGGEGLLWPEKPQGFYTRMNYKDMQRMQLTQNESTKNDWSNSSRFRNENKELISKNIQNQVVFFGNSITENWLRFDRNFFEKNQFVNRGIGGQTTSQMLVRFRQDVIELHPSAVVILAGTNDIAENTGPISIENIFGNIVSMTEIARSNNVTPYLCAVMPVYQYSWNKAVEPVGKILRLNEMIREYAINNKLPYIDFYTPFLDERKGFQQKFSSDGVHPNLEAYKIMEKIIGDELIKSKLRASITY
ncbi:MAG TPA: GDSL-type esterase/lipase family protein [Bacteroidales bacterium]|nr:GDSL-type esterase/lipase family protein [Bacteroidales bacterium]